MNSGKISFVFTQLPNMMVGTWEKKHTHTHIYILYIYGMSQINIRSVTTRAWLARAHCIIRLWAIFLVVSNTLVNLFLLLYGFQANTFFIRLVFFWAVLVY